MGSHIVPPGPHAVTGPGSVDPVTGLIIPAPPELQSLLPFDVNAPKPRYTTAERARLRQESRLLPMGGLLKPPPPPTEDRRLAMYGRISQLTDVSVSLPRQFKENLAHADVLRGTINLETDVFIDNDVSASKGAYRPGMEKLLRRIDEEQAYDGVIVYELPRALRNEVESLSLRQIFLRNSCDLHVVTSPDLSLWGPSSVFFDLFVKVAERESESNAERGRSRHKFMSAVGAVRSRPPFGLIAVEASDRIEGRKGAIRRLAPDRAPREDLGGRSRADLIEEAVTRLVAGESMLAICREWNRVPYRAGGGGSWTPQTLAPILRSPSIAGLANRRRRLIDADGEFIAAGSDVPPHRVGEALVDPDIWFRMMRIFEGRKRVPRTSNEALLSGLGRCGRCAARVTKNGPHYRCVDAAKGTAICGGGNAMSAHRLEGFVLDAAVRALKSKEQRRRSWTVNSPEVLQEVQRLEAQVAALHERLEDLETLWLDTPRKSEEARERNTRRRRETERALSDRTAELARLTATANGEQISKLYADDVEIEQAFRGLPRHVQVTVLHELIERFVLHPSTRQTFQPERIEIVWAAF